MHYLSKKYELLHNLKYIIIYFEIGIINMKKYENDA